LPGKRILLVDANSLANRAFYALPSLSTSKNVPTNAVYGFLTMLFRFVEERKPDYIACAFDHPSPTFRHETYKEYKATRKPSPEAFKAQIPVLKEVLSALEIPIVELAGFEADDIIGTLSRRASEEGMSAIILSGDRDCLQLVDDRVRAILPVKGITQVKEYDRKDVKEGLGVWPEQVTDLKGLSGDSSDNIPGVKGIGEKTALSLLERYGGLEAIYAHLDEITPLRVRNLLLEGRDSAFLSKKLATINTKTPVPLEIEALSWQGPPVDKVKPLFVELEFHTLLPRLKALTEIYREETEQEGLFPGFSPCLSRDDGSTGGPGRNGIQLVDSEQKLQVLTERIFRSGKVSIYAGIPEVTRDFRWPSLIGISPGEGAYLIRDGWASPEKYQELLWKYLGPILTSSQVQKLGFDLKWPSSLCFKRGLFPQGLAFDILVGAYLLDPTRTNYRLDDLSRKYTGFGIPEDPGFLGKDGDGAKGAPTSQEHLALGAAVAFEVSRAMRKDLEDQGLWKLAVEVEFPLIEVLASMEAEGIGVDLKVGKALRDSFARELGQIEQSIFLMAGEEFNLGSPKQLAHILFEKMGLKPVKKTKTGYSTDAEVLEILSEEHDLPAKILEYRQYAKLKSTYLDVLEKVVNPTTGRIHSTFHQTVTATGRLSSSEPNLQNIPVRGELGKSIRRVFIPHPGRLFLASDYSQIELRVMAHMSGDPSMIEAFRKGEDIHARTASEVFGVPISEVTPDLRARAKAVNFGVIYGISDYGLAKQTGVSREEARKFIDMYFQRYPLVKAYMDVMVEKARKDKHVVTILGRKRPIPDIDSRIRSQRGFAERTAINTPIQGSAADIIKLAMVKIYHRMRKEGLVSRMILQVHDELIFEILPSEEEEMRRLVKEEMEGALELKVPLEVEIDVGQSWYDV